ncbi:MAG: ABC transporter substrate-binding protein [Anaerolineales bacterium]|nr:ABC transporter substrate-binding protein [Anaerolineales bacterium]
MKLISRLLPILILIAILMAGCATPTEQPAEEPAVGEPQVEEPEVEEPAAEEPTTLTVWYWGEQEAPGMQSFMEEAAQKYMEQNSNITVDVVLQESDSMYPAFRAAAEAGEGPDIQFFWGGVFTLEDAWLGNLAPISDYWSEDELANLPVGQRAETYWDGKQWGVPFYQIGTFWAYNKKMFAEAGLDPESPPATWDAWMEACDALNAAGYTPIGTGFKDGWLGGWMVSYIGQQNFDSIDDLMAAVKGDANLEDPKYAEWWSRWEEMVDRECFNNDVMSLDLYQGQDLFRLEKAAMTNHVEPFIVVLEREMGADTVGVMRTPVYGSGTLAESVGIPVQALTITSFSPNKEEAADFLKFLHTEDMMKLMYEKAGAVTPDLRFKPEWMDTNVDKQMLEWGQNLDLFWYQYYYPPVWESEGAIALGQLLMAGDIDAAEAAARYQAIAEKWREENPDQLAAYEKWTMPPEMFGE